MKQPNLFKECPSCKKLLYYSTKRILKLSIQHNTICRKCNQSKREETYTDDEINLLKKYYPIGGVNECKKYLNRSNHSISVKAHRLSLNIIRQIAVLDENKICGRCKLELNKSSFGFDKDRKDKLNPICKMCLKKYRMRRDVKNKSNIYHQQYAKQKRKNDIHYRIKQKLRKRLSDVLKTKGIKKSLPTMEFIGCDIIFLKKYIENQFKSGMTWENHGSGNGKWHIDHIRPCASFDLSILENQKECFHYTNLQPLWQEENLSKGANYQISYCKQSNESLKNSCQ